MQHHWKDRHSVWPLPKLRLPPVNVSEAVVMLQDANYSTVATVATSVQPFPKLRLFLANEGYSK